MSANVVGCSEEGLQVLQGTHRRPICYSSHDSRVGRPALSSDDLPHELHLPLGQLELRDAETQRKSRGRIEGFHQRNHVIEQLWVGAFEDNSKLLFKAGVVLLRRDLQLLNSGDLVSVLH